MPYDVVIVIGSQNDLDRVKRSGMLSVLDEVGVSWELSAISAHRHLTDLRRYVDDRCHEGTMVFIGVAGMSAALPGTLAALVSGLKPVLGVALSSAVFSGLDALFSQVRMPTGRPVAVCGLDEAGLYNAALTACSIVALAKPELLPKLASLTAANTKQPAIALAASNKVSPLIKGD